MLFLIIVFQLVYFFVDFKWLQITENNKDKQQELTQPMDQVYSEIENTIHYAAKETPKTISNEVQVPIEEIKEEIPTEKTK